MEDNWELYAELERQLHHLLGELRASFTDSERSEVTNFLEAREYGLAIETISGILVEESKPIQSDVLFEIDRLAHSMDLRDERFMYDLHNAYDHQHRALG